MSNNTENTLRDRYFFNEIFCIGDLVECVKTNEQMKIIDRGSNYVTVATTDGIVKKWLYEIKEHVAENVETTIEENVDVSQPVTESVKVVDKEFELTESGQIKLFGYETKNFDFDVSENIIEQFSEFDDLYSKHQIVKCLDTSMQELDTEYAYSLLEKVDSFYKKQDKLVPFIVEAVKNDTERKRLAEIIAVVAGIEPSKNNKDTIVDSIKAFKEKYKTKQQWEVIYPMLKLAYSMGITTALQNLPYTFNTTVSEEENIDDIVIGVMEENIDLLIEDLEIEDITETFEDDEFSDDITEGLSIETRMALSKKMKQHAPRLAVKRERAMQRTVSTDVLMQRARRLAETMLKRRMFHKSSTDLSRQEKERFESGAGKRRALVARLAQKLIGKVRMLQSTRLHHAPTAPSTKTNDVAVVVQGHPQGAS